MLRIKTIRFRGVCVSSLLYLPQGALANILNVRSRMEAFPNNMVPKLKILKTSLDLLLEGNLEQPGAFCSLFRDAKIPYKPAFPLSMSSTQILSLLVRPKTFPLVQNILSLGRYIGESLGISSVCVCVGAVKLQSHRPLEWRIL